jgi:two-component system cell cycle sensor histidine kinase/response regulator CckA
MNAQQGYLLVVEDIPDILTLLDTTLKLRGYRVVTARNGQEALETMAREHPAMVITDILMPKLDGFGLIHRLRINPETREIPVVVITATYVTNEDREFALDIGATRFLEKPVDLEQFLSIVAELLLQGSHARLEPFDEFNFYEGYRKRLEAKLGQKIAQIARIEHLLGNPSKEEEATLRASLRQAIGEREEIQVLLAQVHEHYKKDIKPE